MLSNLSRHWMRYQESLFDDFEDSCGPMTDRHKEIILALDVISLERFLFDGPSYSVGRPRRSRLAIARAFVAKAALNLSTTKGMIERLKVDSMLRRICGFDSVREIPAESTFSDAFSEFARTDLMSKIHESMIKISFKDVLIGHISRDATEIHAREKIANPGKKLCVKRKYQQAISAGAQGKARLETLSRKIIFRFK